MTILLIALLTAAPAAAHDGPLETFAKRVIAMPEQPAWKKQALQDAMDKGTKPIKFKPTWYCDDDEIGGPTGGGSYVAWWKGGGMRVREGYVATDWKHWPKGSTFYCVELGRTLIATDRGPGVKGATRVDVYCADRKGVRRYKEAARSGRLTLYPIGTVTFEQAKR